MGEADQPQDNENKPSKSSQNHERWSHRGRSNLLRTSVDTSQIYNDRRIQNVPYPREPDSQGPKRWTRALIWMISSLGLLGLIEYYLGVQRILAIFGVFL